MAVELVLPSAGVVSQIEGTITNAETGEIVVAGSFVEAGTLLLIEDGAALRLDTPANISLVLPAGAQLPDLGFDVDAEVAAIQDLLGDGSDGILEDIPSTAAGDESTDSEINDVDSVAMNNGNANPNAGFQTSGLTRGSENSSDLREGGGIRDVGGFVETVRGEISFGSSGVNGPIKIDENAEIGDVVFTVQADSSDGDPVTFGLSDDSDGTFSIDSDNGEVTLEKNLDFETEPQLTLEVTVTGSDGATGSRTYEIEVTDNPNDTDSSVVTGDNDVVVDANENIDVGDVVMTVTALDPDGDEVSYSLVDDSDGRFEIDSETGEVRLTGNLDYESESQHTIDVLIESTDGSSVTQTYIINVTDGGSPDADSSVSEITTSNESPALTEDAEIGDVVMTVSATDADGESVTLELTDDADGLFAIDDQGVVTLANDLDFESATSHTIEVTATSADGSTSTQTYTIGVTDGEAPDTDSSVGEITTSEDSPKLSEDAEVGDTVMTVSATDADGEAVTLELTDNADGLFTIDEDGNVTVAGNLDFESATSHEIEVTATSADGSTSTQTYTIGVTDGEAWDTDSSVSDISTTDETPELSEDAEVGDSVMTVSATDADGEAVTLELTDDADGLFAIDEDGNVTLNGNLDFESATSHSIEVTATSADGSTSTQTYTIGVTDGEAPDTDSSVGEITSTDTAPELSEDAEIGDSVMTVSATDADGEAVTLELTDDADGLFAIDEDGNVTVAGNLDFESATSHTIEVTATSTDGSTSTQTYTIGVTDGEASDTDSSVSEISTTDETPELSEDAEVGDSVMTVSATDADGEAVTLELTDNADGLFAIDEDGNVTLNGNLDFESSTSHEIEVTASSTDGSTSTQTYTIGVTDREASDTDSSVSDISTSDETPELSEDAAVGDSVMTVSATDADGEAVTLELTDDADGLFAIDEDGNVTLNGNLDFESATSHSIEVTATSADGSTSTQTYTIGVTDGEAPDTDSSVSDISTTDETPELSEDAEVGDSVMTVSATDADGEAVTLELTDNADGLFAIDEEGNVTLAGNLDFESATSHSIEVTATSADSSTSTQAYTIGVADGEAPDTDSSVSDISTTDETPELSEDAEVGDSVMTVSAADADGEAVTLELTDDAGGLFAIDEDGNVTVAGNLDFESATSHEIEVTATSADGSTSTQTYTIGVTDGEAPDSDSAVSDISTTDENPELSEDAEIGDAVMTVSATDADGEAVTLELTDNADGLFAIDEDGNVTLNGNLDFESATSHEIEVTATSADGSTSTQTYTIGVTDGEAPDTDSSVSEITTSDDSPELSEDAEIGDAVMTVSATDADGETVTLELTDDADGLFAIDDQGVINLANDLDFESATSHTIEVTATSTDGSTSTQTYNIGVTDGEAPDTDSSVSDISTTDETPELSEDAEIGDTVMTVSATDADGEAVTLELTDDADGLFAIDEDGNVTVAGNLDFESATSHEIEVTATSADGSTSTQTYSIGVTDGEAPDTDSSVSEISTTDETPELSEDAEVGDSVMTVSAADADGEAVTLELTDDADGLFAIDEDGNVTVAGNLDFESATSHEIEVTATSADGSTSTQTYTIGVTDGEAPDTDSSVGEVSFDFEDPEVAENAEVGTVVAQATATDSDGDSVSFALVNDAGGLFAIDATTGQITIASELDYGSGVFQTIEVEATSADGSTTSSSLDIGILDVPETPIITDIRDLSDDSDYSDVVMYGTGDSVGDVIEVFDEDGTLVGSTTVAGDLSWSLDLNALDGTPVNDNEFFTASATNSDDLTSELSSSVHYWHGSWSNAATEGSDDYVLMGEGDDHLTINAQDLNATLVIDGGSGHDTLGLTGVLDDYDFARTDEAVVITTETGATIVIRDIEGFEIGGESVSMAEALGEIGDISTDTDSISVSENSEMGDVAFTAEATDYSGDSVTYELSDDSGLFSIDGESGEVAVNGNLNFEENTSHSVEVTATSSDGSSSTQSFNINITDVEGSDTDNSVSSVNLDVEAPELDSASEVGSLVFTASASDTDGDEISYALSDSASGLFSIDEQSGAVTVVGDLSDAQGSEVSFDVIATSGDGSVASESIVVAIAPEPEPETAELNPSITDVRDESAESDYSQVAVYGTGSEPGNSIDLIDEDGAVVAQATVQDDLTWVIDISSLSGTRNNDNEFFKVTESNVAGDASEATESVHYWHGSWKTARTESSDDYVLMGNGNDTLYVQAEDDNGLLVVDGGAGNDTVIFQAELDHYFLQVSEDEVNLVGSNNLDVVLRDVEEIEVNGESINLEDLVDDIDDRRDEDSDGPGNNGVGNANGRDDSQDSDGPGNNGVGNANGRDDSQDSDGPGNNGVGNANGRDDSQDSDGPGNNGVGNAYGREDNDSRDINEIGDVFVIEALQEGEIMSLSEFDELSDQIDLSQLLDDVETDDLGEYLNFTYDGTNTSLQIDVDGEGDFSDSALVVIEGTDLVGNLTQQDEIIENAMQQGLLHIDT